MAAISDLADLFVATTEYVGRSDFAHVFPRFVALAEDRLSRALRTEGQDTTASLTTDSAGKVALPADFREPLGVKSSDGTDLAGGDLRALDALYPDTGDVRAFAISGGYLNVRPAGVATVSMRYAAGMPRLTSSAPTNAYLHRFSSLYLMATVREFYLWAREAEAAMLADKALAAELAEVIVDEDSRRYGLTRVRLQGVTP